MRSSSQTHFAKKKKKKKKKRSVGVSVFWDFLKYYERQLYGVNGPKMRNCVTHLLLKSQCAQTSR